MALPYAPRETNQGRGFICHIAHDSHVLIILFDVQLIIHVIHPLYSHGTIPIEGRESHTADLDEFDRYVEMMQRDDRRGGYPWEEDVDDYNNCSDDSHKHHNDSDDEYFDDDGRFKGQKSEEGSDDDNYDASKLSP